MVVVVVEGLESGIIFYPQSYQTIKSEMNCFPRNPDYSVNIFIILQILSVTVLLKSRESWGQFFMSSPENTDSDLCEYHY